MSQKMYSVLGYDENHCIYTLLSEKENALEAVAIATSLTAQMNAGQLKRANGDAMNQINVYSDWNRLGEKIIWSSLYLNEPEKQKVILSPILTSYYAKIRNFPENMVPVSISRGVPKWYDGLTYEKLAPLWITVSTYKDNVEKDPTYWENWYNEQYKESILSKLDPCKVAAELQQMVGEGNIPVLLCYEKSSDFCHRTLVADWFGKANLLAREATNEDFIRHKENEQEEIIER